MNDDTIANTRAEIAHAAAYKHCLRELAELQTQIDRLREREAFDAATASEDQQRAELAKREQKYITAGDRVIVVKCRLDPELDAALITQERWCAGEVDIWG